jgi:hypothetical protein
MIRETRWVLQPLMPGTPPTAKQWPNRAIECPKFSSES